jgi:acetylglutamate/LysW-gamma-L-alpha-aminoadipate kinase
MIVVKAGGNGKVNFEAVCLDVAELARHGKRVVLVHGGSNEIDLLSERLGHPPRVVTSPSGHAFRHTDRKTLEILLMALGKVNKLLVERLLGLGVRAFGLSGLDGKVLSAKRKATLRTLEGGKIKVLRDEWSGRITGVNSEVLELLLSRGYVPVVAPIAAGEGGEALNIDGDRAAAAIAAALEAEVLLVLSDVPGVLERFPDPASLIPYIPAAEVGALEAYARGRMKRKVLAAAEALAGGVRTVVITSGRTEHPVLEGLAGAGTVIGEPLAEEDYAPSV